jgi:hypothetical protein
VVVVHCTLSRLDRGKLSCKAFAPACSWADADWMTARDNGSASDRVVGVVTTRSGVATAFKSPARTVTLTSSTQGTTNDTTSIFVAVLINYFTRGMNRLACRMGQSSSGLQTATLAEGNWS